VGFRPFVWQLAQRLQRTGDVCNDGQGVVVRLWGEEAGFMAQMQQACPPLARIDQADVMPFHWPQRPVAFTILPSAGGGMDRTGCSHLSGLPGGDERPDGSPLPLPLRQLHPLRAAGNHYPRYAL